MEKRVQQHEDEKNHLQQHKAEQKEVQQRVEDEQEQVKQHEKHVNDEHQQQQELTKPNPNSPPNIHSPPLELHDSPRSKSPPQQQEDEGEEDEQSVDDEQPPLKPATPPAMDTTKVVVPPPTAPPVDVEPSAGISGSRHLRPSPSILKRSKRESMLRKASLGFRVSGFVFSLVSVSVLAADKDRGWALDSFYRYKEFRYSLAVNVIAFLYSGFRAFDLLYQLTTGKRKSKNHLRCYFDFSMDQILTYLLMSASSSAAVRIDDWQSNWGKDEFPDMAKASVVLSFIAFLSLGVSSLISGYDLCSLKSM